MSEAERTTSMNISLPAQLRDFVEEQVAARGYTSSSEFVRELIRAAMERAHEKERVEALLLEGLASGPAMELDAGFFQELRERIEATRRDKAAS